MNLVGQTKAWLENSNILVPDDWLQACVEWIQEENQGSNLSLDECNSLVYEQWLLADLHELETQCLPAEITANQKYQLTGAYALQIDSIVDVGKSFYSQQQKLKGTVNENVQVSAEEPNYKPWEQKPTRMSMLRLTDGKQSVQGMEYQPISCLNPQTRPGTKILVYGSVLCRHGILMLAEKNIKLLGGEVDTLVEANTIANNLQSAMSVSLEDAEKHHRREFRGSSIKHSQKTDQSNHSLQRERPMPFQNKKVGGTSDYKNQPQNKLKTEKLSQNVKSLANVTNSTNRVNVSTNQVPQDQNYAEFYDAFMDDLDLDDFDEFLGNVDPMFDNPPQQPPLAIPKQENKPGTNNSSVYSNATDNPRLNKAVELILNKRSKTVGLCTNKTNTHIDSVNQPVNELPLGDIDFLDDDFQPMEEDLDFIEQQATARSIRSNSSIANVPQNNNSRIGQNKAQGRRSTENITEATNLTSSQISTSISSNRLNDNRITAKIENRNTAHDKKQRSSTVCNSSKVLSTAELGASNGSIQEERKGTKQTSLDIYCTPNKIQKIKEEQHTTVSMSVQNTDVQIEYPFTYLVKVMLLPRQPQPSFHTVKAYISTLTSKLTCKDNKWTLSCKINDGTMAVDVDLSTKVLTEMIGFSPQEAQKIKLRIKKEPSLKVVLTEGIQQCQQRLIELMCLLELEISAHHPRPLIVATKQVTSHHIDTLYNRVMSSWHTLT